MEIVGVEWRSIMSVLFHVPFLLGHLMNPLISYLTHTWDGFQMAISIPSIFLLSYYWYVYTDHIMIFYLLLHIFLFYYIFSVILTLKVLKVPHNNTWCISCMYSII